MGKIVLITIDCEGEEEQIRRLVKVIEAEQIKVTFFVVGETAEKYPQLFRQLAQKYQVESHTYSHVNLRRLPKHLQKAEIVRGRNAVERITGRKTRGFKAPMHSINKDTIEVLNEQRFDFDVSSLYFNYNLGSVVKLRPSWFREWCGLYEFLRLSPRVPWRIMKLLFQLNSLFVIGVHPQYSGRDETSSVAFRDFIKYLKEKNTRIISIQEYLQIKK